jgi:hypothetical protein
MSDHEALIARNLYLTNWISLGFLAVLLAICLATTNFSIQVDGHFAAKLGTTAGLAFTAHYAFWTHWIRLSYILGLMALFACLSVVAADLSFIVATLNFPLQDGNPLRPAAGKGR